MIKNQKELTSEQCLLLKTVASNQQELAKLMKVSGVPEPNAPPPPPGGLPNPTPGVPGVGGSPTGPPASCSQLSSIWILWYTFHASPCIHGVWVAFTCTATITTNCWPLLELPTGSGSKLGTKRKPKPAKRGVCVARDARSSASTN